MKCQHYHVNSFSFLEFVLPRFLHLIHQFLRLFESFPQIVGLHALLNYTNNVNMYFSYSTYSQLLCALLLATH